MKLQIALIAGLMSISILAGYNPKRFNLNLTIKNAQVTPGILFTMCTNPPLYFTLPDGSRDYVKGVLFNISQRKNGNYDVDYEITSYNSSHKIEMKGTKKDSVERILQKTFPQVFISKDQQQKYYFLRNLEKDPADRAVFKNVVNLMNGFLPQTAQLTFDEKDFSAIQFNEWRAWFSLDAWRNWLAWRNER